MPIAVENFPKIDAHFHANHFKEAYLQLAARYNTRYITINTDTDIFPPVAEQEQTARSLQKEFPDLFTYVCSFSMDGWQEDTWYPNVYNSIKASLAAGAVAVKIWKNIGMQIRKPDGRFLMIDDPFFQPLFQWLQEAQVPMLTHLGEPRNCWLPLHEMTTIRNREYYTKHPEFHAYLHPEIPSYEKQIAARDQILNRYPQLKMVGAHLGSLEWSIDELASRFRRYPNFFVDCSSRMGHLQLQSVHRHEAVRHFFIEYADRILYGTDAYDNPEKLEHALVNDWQFLATNEDGQVPGQAGNFRGLSLPEQVLHQIYFDNALKIYNRLSYKKNS